MAGKPFCPTEGQGEWNEALQKKFCEHIAARLKDAKDDRVRAPHADITLDCARAESLNRPRMRATAWRAGSRPEPPLLTRQLGAWAQAQNSVLYRELYELLRLALEGGIPHAQLGEALKKLKEKVDHDKLEETISDVVWVLGEEAIEEELKRSDAPPKDQLAPVVQQIVSSGVARDDILKERVSEEALQARPRPKRSRRGAARG